MSGRPGGPDLSVLLVTYNSAAFIGECIEAVQGTVTRHTYEIVLADNGSSDGSAELVRRRHPDVMVLELGANLGFAKGNNAAMARATGRHIVLLNGDAFVQPGALDALVDFLDATPRAGVAAPALLNLDGTNQGTARAFPTPAAALFGRRSPLTRAFPANRWSRRYLMADPLQATGPFETDWVSGACLMVPRWVIDEVGPLDEGFFMHWEDADWCHRIKDAGYAVHTIPAARVLHAEGASRKGWPARQVRGFHRSAYRYYAKHHAAGLRRPLRPLVAALLSGRALAVVATNRAANRAANPARTPQPTPAAEPVAALGGSRGGRTP